MSSGVPTDEVHVFFGVFGFDHPAEVTRTIGLEPSRAWLRGEPTGTGKGFHTHSRWTLEVEVRGSDEIGTRIEQLLDALEAKKEGVLAATERFECTVGVAAYYHDDFNPGFSINARTTRRLAELGLGLDFDLYFLGNDD